MQQPLIGHLSTRRGWMRPRRRERIARKLVSLVVVLLEGRRDTGSAPALGAH